MTGIDIAALLTSLLAAAAFGTLIYQLCDATDRIWILCLGLLGLPLSMLAFYAVRMPLDSLLTGWLGKGSTLLTTCQLWYAPLTEETAKLFPLLVAWPIFRRQLNDTNRVPVAMALGLGFAIGEMWLVAQFVRSNPEFSELPFYQFGGFINERLATCLAHPGFTVLALWGLQRKGFRAALGIIAAMTFHFASNFPIYLMGVDLGNLGRPTWAMIVSGWLLICVIASVLTLAVMHAGTKRIVHLVMTAKVKCPECGELYRQPILGGNFGVWRYEPCGACHKWHWVSLKDIQ